MISDADLAAAKARLLDVIGAEVALKPAGREFRGLCPFHNEKTPSFYVVPDKGMWHCFGCGAHGDAVGFTMRLNQLDFPEAVKQILGLPAEVAHRAPQRPMPAAPREDDAILQRVRELLAASAPLVDTHGSIYLWSRGLKATQPALRVHRAVYCSEAGRTLPALLAPIIDSDDGEPCAVQRIWFTETMTPLTGDAPQDARAALQVRKKTLGHMGGGAVRLAPAGPSLGLAEGVETAIAASMLFRMPVWATCGAARLGRVWLPDVVESVIVFGDNGRTGRDLGRAAEATLIERGFQAMAVFPDVMFGDFNDQLIGKRMA